MTEIKTRHGGQTDVLLRKIKIKTPTQSYYIKDSSARNFDHDYAMVILNGQLDLKLTFSKNS